MHRVEGTGDERRGVGCEGRDWFTRDRSQLPKNDPTIRIIMIWLIIGILVIMDTLYVKGEKWGWGVVEFDQINVGVE